MNIPYYLKAHLESAELLNYVIEGKYDELLIFNWLKASKPSLGYKVLYDLYSIYHNLAINSISKEQQSHIVQKYHKLPPSYIPLDSDLIEIYLNHALSYAHQAFASQEVPIGAIIVDNNKIIAYGYNQTRAYNSIISHAEIMAINMATRTLGTHRLTNCDLYVTIEPCIMCVGTILHSRLRRVIFGATEPKTGGVISQIGTITTNPILNPQTEFIGPIDNAKFSHLLKEFFTNKR